MIGLTDIFQIVELAIWSAAIANEHNPVSVLIMGEPESGKSQVISAFDGNRYCQLHNDITAWGLARQAVPRALKGNPMLLIPDLTNPLSRGRETVASLTATLSSFIEEGVKSIATKFINISYPQPVCGGVITALTPEELKWRHAVWVTTGFLSRFLVISYTYSNDVQNSIRAFLRQRDPKSGTSLNLNLPLMPVPVKTNPQDLARFEPTVEKYLDDLRLRPHSYGFRAQLHLQRLAMGAALREGRDVVQQQDVTLVQELVSKYANLQYRAIA